MTSQKWTLCRPGSRMGWEECEREQSQASPIDHVNKMAKMMLASPLTGVARMAE